MKKTTTFLVCMFMLLLPTCVNAADDIEYINDSLGFRLTLPSSWEGLYRVHEHVSNMANGVWVQFSNIRNEDAGYGGEVFSIFISGEEAGDIPGMREILRTDGKIVYYSVPTDVQFDHNDRSLTNEYKKMENDVKNIIGTFRFVTPEPYE